jgi:precorrin-6B methylase 2
MLRRFGLEKQVKTIKKTAEKAAPEIQEIDILYMDAIYSEKMADGIIRLYLPKVRSGGYVWINDATGEKTQAACDFLLESCDFVKDIDGSNCLLFKKRST